jgi:hypothetical protein
VTTSRLISRSLAATCALALAPVAPAHADFFPGETIDGPSGDVVRLGDVDVARDGTGGVVYVKREGGAEHVFLSRLVGGAFRAPERVDAGLGGPSGQPVIAATDRGRLAIAFVSSGALHAVVVRGTSQGVSAAQHLAAGASNPSIDMSINGAAYISFTAPGASNADVHAARLDRDATSFSVLGGSLDLEPARAAGDGPVKRSRVAVAADGTGLVTWGEDAADGQTRVIARRVFGMSISSLPQDISLDSLQGRAGAGADSPDVDIEDDSSFAWVVFRQSFTEAPATLTESATARSRVIARRLVGSRFEAPVTVDPLSFPAPEGADGPRLDLNGTGQGLAASQTQTGNQVYAARLDLDEFAPAQRLTTSSNAIPPLPQPTVSQTGDGVVAWLSSGSVTDPASVRARQVLKSGLGPEAELSRSDLGGVDGTLGFDAAASRYGDTVVGYVQGGAAERRIMAATYDRAPVAFVGLTTSKPRPAQPLLRWSPALEVWGLTYRIEIDGVAVGTTGETRFKVAKIAGGTHRWRVVAVDRHGQQTAAPTRVLRVDAGLPRLRLTVAGRQRAGSPVRFVLRASDPRTTGATGLRGTRLDFGDGSGVSTLRRVAHRYRRRGTFTVRASARDRAGNVTVVRRRVRIR